MTTNREWLYSLDGSELADWFDAQHVDANDTLSAENDVSAEGMGANDANVAQDSREKLEADASELTADYAASGDVCDALYGCIVELLDRQAAITERELCKQCDWPSLAAQPDEEAYERIANLTDDLEIAYAKNRVLRAHISKMQNGRNGWHIKAEKLQKQIDELTAERDALADDLQTCNREREQYRELLSEAITHAHEIVNLQP